MNERSGQVQLSPARPETEYAISIITPCHHLIGREPHLAADVYVSGLSHSVTLTISAAAMDPWKEYAAFEECRDAVRQWAELEGKSPQMADELAREYANQSRQSIDTPLVIAASVRFAAWVIETWWYLMRR